MVTRSTSKSVKKSRKTATSGKEVRIRMYNVGFGDAFLVILPVGDKERRILFDCGSVEAADGVPMANVVKRIIDDVTDEDGVARIDVIVATHRHKDHVSGFGNDAWDRVEVKEVWMPWTEDTSDPEARRIRDKQSRLAFELEASLKMQAAALSAKDRKELERSIDIVDNALMLTNEKEMKRLHNGFAGEPERRFLPAKEKDKDKYSRLLKTDVLPGVKVHVLGPSRNPEVIRDMDPPQGESFLRMRGALNTESGLPAPPFAAEFRQDSSPATLTDKDRSEVRKAGSFNDLAVAVALDKAVNGTSLMLILEVAGTYLLFPGDAQWGTWSAAMEDPEWRQMMKSVAFYKVGHHGSHNATPKDFVDGIMPDGICAMASTRMRPVWPDIPRLPLLTRLAEKNINVARSDQPTKLGKTFQLDNGVIETRIPL